jgi:hypothetical protein
VISVAPDRGAASIGCRHAVLADAAPTGNHLPKEPEGDIEALKDAYVTVARSFSLAMAKELRCEKNGGLPARPVLDPA